MLAALPPEILYEIISYLSTAASVSSLSQTCHRLHDIIKTEGWRCFTQHRFPNLPAASLENWVDAAQSLTALSRSWERQAFIASYLHEKVFSGRKQRWSRGTGRQTLGYRPVIDSYQEQLSGKWASKREVVAWAAGPNLVIRSKTAGDYASNQARQEKWKKKTSRLDQHGHYHEFSEYQAAGAREGFDDITTVNMLRPHQKRYDGQRDTNPEIVIIGRLNGELAAISNLDEKGAGSASLVRYYETSARGVRAAALSTSEDPLLAVCLECCHVAFYKATSDHQKVKALSGVDMADATSRTRAWSVAFLTSERLAVGVGPSQNSIQIIALTNDGARRNPERRFSMCDEQQNDLQAEDRKSVYALIGLPSNSVGGGSPGDLLLSGCDDGRCRIHDMRSPQQSVASFVDPSQPPDVIYSIASVGQERFVAGGARHALMRVFDLRKPGSNAYSYFEASPCQSIFNHGKDAVYKSNYDESFSPLHEARYAHKHWSVFASPQRAKGTCSVHSVSSNSPIYSLSSPSPASPTLFAGVENGIVEFNFVSATEEMKHPDPQFVRYPSKDKRSRTEIRKKWDPFNDALNLSAYSHCPKVLLRHQAPISSKSGCKEPFSFPYLDERWGMRRFRESCPQGRWR